MSMDDLRNEASWQDLAGDLEQHARSRMGTDWHIHECGECGSAATCTFDGCKVDAKGFAVPPGTCEYCQEDIQEQAALEDGLSVDSPY